MEAPVELVAPGRVVAAVYSPGTLAAALALGPLPAAPDWLELRLDGFAAQPGALDALVALAPRPFVVTVRHPAEGGLPGATADPAQRRERYERYLASPAVVGVDIEVRSIRALAAIIQEVRATDRQVVASFHDFQGVPPLGKMREMAERAMAGGGTVFKLAATVQTPGELARLLDFAEWGRGRRLALAIMGMGPLGRVSRLALAAAGSVLNYGYLGDGEAQIPGQWPAAILRERIAECRLETGQKRTPD